MRANRLAHFLVAAGAVPESVVGLCLGRGVELLVAVLAIWKAGAAYLPLDPGLPAGRLAFMLADSRVGVVVGASEALEDLPAGRVRMIAIDDAVVDSLPAQAPPVSVRSGLVAYLLYT